MIDSAIGQPRSLSHVRMRAGVLALALVLAPACTQSPATELGPNGEQRASSPASAPDATIHADADPASNDSERSAASRDASTAVDPLRDASAPSSADAEASPAPTAAPSAADSGAPADSFDDEDAGATAEPSCTSRTCLCTSVCSLGTSLRCVDEAPLEDCIRLCDQPPPPACAHEAALALACNAAQPASSYSCDADLWVFVLAGCANEEAALQACRIR